MCGIFAYLGKSNQAVKSVFNGLKELEYRGYDSWGIAAATTDKQGKSGLFIIKRTGKIGKVKLDRFPKSGFAFGHTRWATHGGITKENAHPHLDCSGSLAVIHNGIVENYAQLKSDLKKEGHRFTSRTDSEVIVHLVEKYCRNSSFSQAVSKAFLKLKGLNAVIIMNLKTNEFAAVRNGSPLVIGFGRSEFVISSDNFGITPYTDQAYYLKNFEMAIVNQNGVAVKAVISGKNKKVKKEKLEWKIDQVNKGKYAHYMLKEIFEQPKLIKKISCEKNNKFSRLGKALLRAEERYLLGCGSAAYAGLAGSYIMSQIANLKVEPVVGSEFCYQLHSISKKSLILALSQSGETIDTLEAVRTAKAKNAQVAALVNVPGSSLYREVKFNLLLLAGPEKAVASTKAFTAKIANLLMLAGSISKSLETASKFLAKAAVSIEAILANTSRRKIANLAGKIIKQKDIYVIGRGLSFPAALETALKIKEVSYLHAEGFAAGELKHGVIALIKKGTPCIAFLPEDETYGENLAGAMEMKARGGYIIGVSSRPHKIFDYYIRVSDAGPATIIPNVVFGQLLAYELSLKKGIDPDMPRNLAKSVTVKINPSAAVRKKEISTWYTNPVWVGTRSPLNTPFLVFGTL